MTGDPTAPAAGDDDGLRRQREYYARTASDYDELHVRSDDEHAIALGWMTAMIEQRGYRSVLDVGAGTGRVLSYLGQRSPGVDICGVEPSQALRDIAYGKGVSPDRLREGDALALPFADDSFDLVCAYGVMHHIADHRRAAAEMSRVARRAVFISDANNFGQGGAGSRLVKQALRAVGLWKAFDLARTGFKGYHYSEGDGVFYSYTLFDDLPIVTRKFPETLYMSTRPSGANFFRTAQTIAVHASRPVAARK